MTLLRLIALLALVGCSHDTKRENPLDPELTPPPQLQVALDDTAGTATLSWTPYEGEAPFAEYWVLRNAVESSRVETLTTITDVATTVFSDTALESDTAYEYRLSTVNSAGLEVPSDKQSISGYTIDAVTLLSPETNSEEGTITLRWSRYRDPGFEAYRLFRRVAGTDVEQLLSDISSVTDTTFADSTARHGVDYIYRVAAETTFGSLFSSGLDARLNLPAVELEADDSGPIDLLGAVDREPALAGNVHHLGMGLSRPRGLVHFVGVRVTHGDEPLAATQGMVPPLPLVPGHVAAGVEVFRPHLRGRVRLRPLHGLAAEPKLVYIALPTVGAANQECHGLW